MRAANVLKMVTMLGLGYLLAAPVLGETSNEQPDQQMARVILETSKGKITLELFTEQAPITTENFLSYVESGFYEGTIFHRVIPGFMIQGGGMTSDMERKKTNAPIKNEADNGLKNKRGTLSMARTQNVDSATSQFFINVADNAFLDHGARDFGYAVFAQVIDGMDVVDRISQVPTRRSGMHGDVPREPVLILNASVAD